MTIGLHVSEEGDLSRHMHWTLMDFLLLNNSFSRCWTRFKTLLNRK